MITGTTTSSSAMIRIASEIGWVKKTLTSPWLIVSARRNCCSASGPRIRPTTQGATGTSSTRIPKPTAPMIQSTTRSTTLLLSV